MILLAGHSRPATRTRHETRPQPRNFLIGVEAPNLFVRSRLFQLKIKCQTRKPHSRQDGSIDASKRLEVFWGERTSSQYFSKSWQRCLEGMLELRSIPASCRFEIATTRSSAVEVQPNNHAHASPATTTPTTPSKQNPWVLPLE